MSEDHDLIRQARRLRELLRIGSAPVDLAAVDPGSTPGVPDRVGTATGPKEWARAETARLAPLLAGHQERLYARAQVGDGRDRLLLVLQAMDCGGKDGTVKSLVRAFNPQGVRIVPFGPPTVEESAHHFLWRICRALPPAGLIGVFNRSHYEDVLVARVRRLVPEPVWAVRYDQINRFEADLAADGMRILKVMLHISASEQRERLRARLDDPTKRWKFAPGDLDDRDRWEEYQRAYADAVGRCATEHAPWYVVPADRKWYRNWAVANLVLAHLADLRLEYPAVDLDLAEQKRRLDEGIRGQERQVNST